MVLEEPLHEIKNTTIPFCEKCFTCINQWDQIDFDLKNFTNGIKDIFRLVFFIYV